MRLSHAEVDLDFENESVETLLLMTVLGQTSFRHAAICELKRRGSLSKDLDERDDVFMTNLSGIC